MFEKSKINKLNRDQLKDKPILGHKGYAMAKKLEEQGAYIIYIENTTNKELFEIYLKNSDKYNGIVLSYCDGENHINGKSDLTNTREFGLEPISFIVNNDKIELLELLNNTILKLRSNGELNSLCLQNYGSFDDTTICSLK